jgi:sec-independent protein translocase protein TatB
MLPQIGSTEMLVIAAIALIVVGPKDLPMLLRKLGQFVARLRNMASDFRTSFDEMARQSELDDLRREVASMRDAAAAEKATIDSSMSLLDSEMQSIDAAVQAQLSESGSPDPAPAVEAVAAPAAPEAPVKTPRTRTATADDPEAPGNPKAPARAKSAPKAKA